MHFFQQFPTVPQITVFLYFCVILAYWGWHRLYGTVKGRKIAQLTFSLSDLFPEGHCSLEISLGQILSLGLE